MYLKLAWYFKYRELGFYERAYSFYAPFARNRLKMAGPVDPEKGEGRTWGLGILNDAVSLLSRLTLIFILR